LRIIALRTIREFWERHPPAERPLRGWYTYVDKAKWAGPADVKTMFGANVDFIADNRAIFDIGGNKYRLVAHISYPYGRVLVKFVGTHAEYDAIDPRNV